MLAAAEGDAYGKQDGGGNGAAYLANALVSAAAAAVFILSPETVRCCALSPVTSGQAGLLPCCVSSRCVGPELC